VSVLFGKELPRHGITCDLVAQSPLSGQNGEALWQSGEVFLCPRTGTRTRDQVLAFWHDCRTLWKAKSKDYDAIQVRDKVFAGMIGLACARLQRLPFFYWMSFPMSEGFIDLAHREGLSLGILRWIFVAIKGHLGKYLIYRILLPRCNHVFVQSDYMASELARRGIQRDRMTAVPMGVDLERLATIPASPAPSTRELAGRRVIAYLGALDRVRRIDFLLEVLANLRTQVPNVCLLLVGEANEEADREWLRSKARELEVDDAIVWTRWLPMDLAWGYLRHADLAVSVVPRGQLFDCASPTKVVEYLALGIPVVANDQPDQHKLLTESGAGLSVAMSVREFSGAIVRILNDESLAASMTAAGPSYVRTRRSYALIGEGLAKVYRALLPNA
jgi:glycosyltransferase involved in cell wall biosynthesis